MKEKIKVSIEAKTTEDGLIEMCLKSEAQEIGRWVADIQDKAIRESLIKLGWTPPAEVS